MAIIADLYGNGKGGLFGGGGGFSGATVNDFGGAVSDLFAAQGDQAKAQGDILEGQNYTLAATLAGQNEQFAETSTEIKQAQADRQLYLQIGGQKADVAGAGFAESGSAIDLLRSSAQQGALNRAVLGQQGLIQEAGYKEQQQSYQNMAQAAQVAADAEKSAATGAEIGSAIKGVAALATLF